jgi:hypothetical protein
LRNDLVTDMAIVVPQPNYRLGQVMFVAQGTQARCAQDKVPAGPRFHIQPTSRKHAQKLAAGKKQHIVLNRADTLYRPIRSRSNLLR